MTDFISSGQIWNGQTQLPSLRTNTHRLTCGKSICIVDPGQSLNNSEFLSLHHGERTLVRFRTPFEQLDQRIFGSYRDLYYKVGYSFAGWNEDKTLRGNKFFGYEGTKSADPNVRLYYKGNFKISPLELRSFHDRSQLTEQTALWETSCNNGQSQTATFAIKTLDRICVYFNVYDQSQTRLLIAGPETGAFLINSLSAQTSWKVFGMAEHTPFKGVFDFSNGSLVDENFNSLSLPTVKEYLMRIAGEWNDLSNAACFSGHIASLEKNFTQIETIGQPSSSVPSIS